MKILPGQACLPFRAIHGLVKPCACRPATSCAGPNSPDRARLFHLALRHVHDHTRRQIKPRHDGLQLDVFGVVGVGAKAAETKALDDGGLGLQRRERGVGAAASGGLDHFQRQPDFPVDRGAVGVVRAQQGCPRGRAGITAGAESIVEAIQREYEYVAADFSGRVRETTA